jgi:3-oxoacyl-[acyl-carrier protein] reductase
MRDISMAGQDKRVIVVTGASRGLGREIALRFGRDGDRVVIHYLNRDADARVVAEQVRDSGGEPLLIRADMKVPAEIEDMVSRVTERWGGIDVLVNNAGITRDSLVLRMSEEDWDAVLDTDLKGPFVCIRAASRSMMKMRSGHIISVASLSGVQGRGGQANYSAAKAGLIGLSKAAARELGRFNIQVNAIVPGYLATDMGRTVTAEMEDRIKRENVLGRSSSMQEVAEFVYRLSLMKNVSGQMFNLDSRVF